MGLVTCNTCGGSASDKAKHCVHCGEPFARQAQGRISWILTLILGAGYLGLALCTLAELLMRIERPDALPRDAVEVIALFGWIGTMIGLAILLILLHRSRSRTVSIATAHQPFIAPRRNGSSSGQETLEEIVRKAG